MSENDIKRQQAFQAIFKQLQETDIPFIPTVRSKLTNFVLQPNSIAEYFRRGEPVIIEFEPETPLRRDGFEIPSFGTQAFATPSSKDIIVDDLSLERVADNIIRVQYPAETKILFSQMDLLLEPVRAIYFIYSIIGLMTIVDTDHLEEILSDRKRLTINLLDNILLSENIELLSVGTFHYGSPVSVDVIGLGSLIEKTYELFQKVKWRDRYEREKAAYELSNMQLDNLLKHLDAIEKFEKSKLPKKQKDIVVSGLHRNVRSLLSATTGGNEERVNGKLLQSPRSNLIRLKKGN